MERTDLTVDFRIYRPASILVIDLVKHSARPKGVVQFLQTNLEQVFLAAKMRMKLEDVYFKYTGDGYVCAFIGDASARVMDFINFTLPELRYRFAQQDQKVRVGLDFGLIHLSENALTKGSEHFDLPGIRAARLEAVAEADQVLCTETVHRIFSRHYPQMFDKPPRTIQTKDMEILAYEVLAYDCAELQELFSAYLFRTASIEASLTRQPMKIMVVDDDYLLTKLMSEQIRRSWPDIEVITASSGKEALALWQPKAFLVVLTDQMMPGLSGLDFTKQVISQDPEQSVVMLTADTSVETAIEFMQIGGTDYLTKPCTFDEIDEVFRQAITGQTLQVIRSRLGILSEKTGSLLMLLRGVSSQLHAILAKVNDTNDVARGLLRHKAKQLVSDFVKTILPGQDFHSSLSTLQTQLRCLQRHSDTLGRVQVGEIETYLDQYVGDLQELYPGVEFRLFSKPARNPSVTISSGTELILIVCELIDNALHAITNSGKVDITISTLKATGIVQITVKDNGPGVRAEIEGRMFEQGISTKGVGRGLGLCLVQEAVHMLKGEIRYEHRNGAEFKILLPFR